jgi:hypothetical protein
VSSTPAPYSGDTYLLIYRIPESRSSPPGSVSSLLMAAERAGDIAMLVLTLFSLLADACPSPAR